MSPPEMKSDDPEIAVLNERLARLSEDCRELKTLIQPLSQSLSIIPTLQRDLALMQQQSQKQFDLLDAHNTLIRAQASIVSSHSLIWKIVAGLLIASNGWLLYVVKSYSDTQQNLSTVDYNIEKRVTVLEFRQSVLEK